MYQLTSLDARARPEPTSAPTVTTLDQRMAIEVARHAAGASGRSAAVTASLGRSRQARRHQSDARIAAARLVDTLRDAAEA
jgi:hypothetical protein